MQDRASPGSGRPEMRKQAEANLSGLIESTDDLIWSVDLDYRLITFNSALQKHILTTNGVRLAAGMLPVETMRTESADFMRPLYDRAVREGPFRTEFDLGDGHTLELSLNPIVTDGETTGISVFGKDLSERKAEQESHRFLAGIVESSGDGIIAYDLSGGILTWNRGAEIIFGYPAEEAIGKPLAMVVVPERRPGLDQYTAALVQGSATPQRQGIGLRKDGQRIDVSVTSWPIRDFSGKVTAISIIVRDVSIRREGDKAWALLASIVESSTDAIHAVNLDGTVVSWNRGAELLFGYTRDDAIGKSIAILAPPGREEEVRQLMGIIGTGGVISPFETVLRAKDGRDIDVWLSISPIRNTDGEVAGASAIARDMTAHKQAEMALREADRKYRTIVDGALEGMFQTTPEGKALFANRALARMLGYDSSEEFVSKVTDVKDHIWANPDDRATFLERIREHDSVLGYECQFKRKDGTRIDVALSARRIFGAGGEWLALEGFIEDVSEHKRVENELRESRDSLREAQIIGGLGSYVLDIPKGRWTSSSLLDELFGIDEGYERSVDGWAALTHPDDWAMMTAYFAEEVIGQKKAFDKEYRITRQTDRSTRWVHGQGRLEFDAHGQPVTMRGVIRDITESKLASQKLEESEARFRRFFEENGSLMLIVDPSSGMIMHANRAAAEYYGLPQEQLIGRSALQMSTSPADEVERNLQRALAGKRSVFNFRIRIASGVERDVEAYASPVDMDGKQLLYAIVHDISERRRAEAQLRDSEERYRATFQMNIDAININRLSDGVFVDCNEAFLRFIGCERVEVIGRTSQELNFWVDPGDRQKWVEALRRDSRCRDLEARFRRKNGEVVWGQASGSLIDADGVPCILSVTRDITAAKAADDRLAAAVEALRLSEDRYRTTFEMSLDVISITRIDSGEYIDANPAFLELGGYKREEVIGHTAEELGVWADLLDRDRLTEAVRRNGSCRDLEARFRKKNGEPFWGLLSASLMTIDSKRCLLSVIRDITAAKAADDLLAAAMDALRASEAHYRTVFQTSVDGICVSQLDDGTYIDANNAFLSLMGYEREEVIGRTSLELNFWSDPEVRTEMVDSLSRNQSLRDMETQFIRKNGERIWIQISATAMDIEGAQCVLSVVRDISAAKAAEEGLAAAQRALQASEERYRTSFQTSLDSININRLSDGYYIDCNQAFLDLVGYTREEVIGRTSIELNIWANARDRQNLVDMVSQTGSCRDLEAQFRKKNGDLFWGQMSASVIEIDGVPCILSISRDISNAKVAEDEIRTLAFYDPLTHLPNRRLVSERLRQSLAASARSSRKGALLFFDVDNFKTLNDTLGHKTGDLLLQEIARRLTGCIREVDTVARLGGDEFVVILEDLSESPEEAAAHAKVVAQKILGEVCQTYLLAGRECLSTSSIGITLFGNRTDTIDDVLQQADIAMYQAKAAGRNTLRFFAPELQAAINTRASMEEEMRQAIGTGQFQLYYQPQVQFGALIGAEALLRWNHPARGFLPPVDFISLAEETGLILPLGEWVLETACRQIAAWSNWKETAHITVAVNISARQLRQPDFVEQVLGALERTGANPKNLELELTESMLVDNIEEVIAKMTVLKSHGLRFSLDDFGTGYSSLSYLKRLPLDQLKIDRAFVHDMLVDVTSGAIAQTVISLSKAMGLSVMAEGVETEEQRDFLASLGCHAFQGFLFSPPLPLREFEMLLPEIAERVVPPPSVH